MFISHSRFKPVLNTIEYISLGGILLGISIGCKPSPISIAQISEKRVGKTVHLTGKVVHLAPLVDNAVYQIEDSTGRAWVVTAKESPVLGQKIALEGKIKYQSLPFADRELGDFYVVELKKLPDSDR